MAVFRHCEPKAKQSVYRVYPKDCFTAFAMTSDVSAMTGRYFNRV
ncbi:hypothetical protein GP5015_929 [gamma proteobacterium HTCC5015]|nr:hypothetical protein GP5015_929 [gamma proteobacterium HTCC5015]